MKYNMMAVVCLTCFLMFTPFLSTTRVTQDLVIIVNGKALTCCVCGCKNIQHVIGRNGDVKAYCDRCIKTRA